MPAQTITHVTFHSLSVAKHYPFHCAKASPTHLLRQRAMEVGLLLVVFKPIAVKMPSNLPLQLAAKRHHPALLYIAHAKHGNRCPDLPLLAPGFLPILPLEP